VRSILNESEFVTVSADFGHFARNDLGNRSATHPYGSDDKSNSDESQARNRYENEAGQSYGFHGHPSMVEVPTRLSHRVLRAKYAVTLGISDVHWSTTAEPMVKPTAQDR
jgi:hypothetical protein